MLRAHYAHTAFICFVRCMRMPCQMLHSQYAQCAYLVSCCMCNICIPCKMLHAINMRVLFQMVHAQFGHTLSDVSCALCAYRLQTDVFCIFSVGLELHYAEAAKCWYFGGCFQTYFSCKSEEVWWLRKVL
jgi:hypothetical protein